MTRSMGVMKADATMPAESPVATLATIGGRPVWFHSVLSGV